MPAVRLTPAARVEVRRIDRDLEDARMWGRIYRMWVEANAKRQSGLEARLAALLGRGESKEG